MTQTMSCSETVTQEHFFTPTAATDCFPKAFIPAAGLSGQSRRTGERSAGCFRRPWQPRPGRSGRRSFDCPPSPIWSAPNGRQSVVRAVLPSGGASGRLWWAIRGAVLFSSRLDRAKIAYCVLMLIVIFCITFDFILCISDFDFILYYNLLLCFIPLEIHVRLICAIKFYLLTYLRYCRAARPI